MAEMKEIKRVKNAILYHDKNDQPLIRIDKCRLSYAFIGTPSDEENDEGVKSKRWRSNFLLPKKTHKEAHALVEKVIEDLIAENKAKVGADKRFLSDGDEKEDEHSQDHWIIVAADGKIRPKARNRRGEVMDDVDAIDKMFYSGAWAHVLIRPWFFAGKTKSSTKTFPKRVSAGLNGVVFFEDDTPFGSGRIDDSDAWDDLPESDQAGDDDEDM